MSNVVLGSFVVLGVKSFVVEWWLTICREARFAAFVQSAMQEGEEGLASQGEEEVPEVAAEAQGGLGVLGRYLGAAKIAMGPGGCSTIEQQWCNSVVSMG